MRRRRSRAQSKAEAQRQAARLRRPVSTDLVMEAIDQAGKTQAFTFPGDKMIVAVNQIPSLRAKGFRNIRITNAA